MKKNDLNSLLTLKMNFHVVQHIRGSTIIGTPPPIRTVDRDILLPALLARVLRSTHTRRLTLRFRPLIATATRLNPELSLKQAKSHPMHRVCFRFIPDTTSKSQTQSHAFYESANMYEHLASFQRTVHKL